MMFDLETAIKNLGLGNLTAQPKRVEGGYLHKMFKLETTTGKYAVKLLNPIIMKRPGVLDDYKRAESIEQILSEHSIPIVPALEIHGARMQKLDGQYFYLFEWTEAKALAWHEIKGEHCRVMGELLARIHKIPLHGSRPDEACQSCGKVDYKKHAEYALSDEVRSPKDISCGMPFGYTLSDEVRPSRRDMYYGMPFGYTLSDRKFHVDWDRYIRLAGEMHSELAEALVENRELLYQAQREYNAAIGSVPDIVCITDGDMDCKNVLWKNGQPFIIDLECLDHGNPFLEMFQLALSWAGAAVCDMDFERLGHFLGAYQSEYGEVNVDWKTLSGAGFSWLDWLEYNTKRALLIECGDEEEQKLGIREAGETIRRIIYYDTVREDISNSLT